MSAPAGPRVKADAHTRARQAQASDPARSAWVSANAGSGKTYVLTQRVVRLLLAGADPSRILCLTFTKAAAAEMSNRVFDTLSNWAVMDADALAGAVEEISGERPGGQRLKQARRLFARALETPGGLKIQTIHAFCEALLHQFPLEAGIPGHFDVLDDALRAELIAEARRQTVVRATAGSDERLSAAFGRLLEAAGDQKIEDALMEAIGRRNELHRWFARHDGIGAAMSALGRHLDIGEDDSIDRVFAEALSGPVISASFLAELADTAASSDKPTDRKLAERIIAAQNTREPAERFEKYCDIWLTQTRKIRAYRAFAAAPVKSQFDDLEEKITAEGERLQAAIDRINLLRQFEESSALFHVAGAVIERFEGLKARRRLLDFDDLIVRTAELLSRSNAHHWVQYKLDQGIDHVLVDEAQDTNPFQWEVINALVEEFFSGEGAREIRRSVFAVGDEKQSIFSFQGAVPDAFADQRDRLQASARKAGYPFSPVTLSLSFRATPDVLSAVDEVFADARNHAGLSRDRQPTIHDTIRRNEPGQVDIWPPILKKKATEPTSWTAPVDQPEENDPQILLARKIAGQISDWLKSGSRLEGSGRPIRAGDILVLVRSRDRFITALTRELKNAGVPIAGTDRLRLTDHIVVQDLLALGQVMLLPQDDLSLATVLKGPLFDLDETQLFDLAAHRGQQSLFRMLMRVDADETVRAVAKRLKTLRQRAAKSTAFEFYSELLGADGGRKKIMSRFGVEAEDVLDAFVAQTLEHEKRGEPGLQQFIEWLSAAAPEIKREFSTMADEVRIMTVHSAKGLEAPIVFLVDKCTTPYHGRHDPALVEVGSDGEPDRGFLWLAESKRASGPARQALEEVKQKALAEYQRLLYVAMTRAADRLIVCGAAPEHGAHEDCWYSVISRALCGKSTEHRNTDGTMAFYRWQTSPARDASAEDTEPDAEPPPPTSLPDWTGRHLPAEPELPAPLTPSGAQTLIDAEAGPGQVQSLLSEDETNPSFAARRGVAIHRLLQRLPEIGGKEPAARIRARRDAAVAYLEAICNDWALPAREAIIAEVLAVLEAPQFADLFTPGSGRAEVAISGLVNLASGPRLVSGQIDRLVAGNDKVVIIDYKTNRPAPQNVSDIPDTYVSQLALYRHLVQRIYPLKPVEAALLWTDIPKLVRLPDKRLDEQLSKIERA